MKSEAQKRADKRYYEKNRAKFREASERWYKKNRQVHIQRSVDYYKSMPREVRKERNRRCAQNLKDKVYEAYGGYVCACCDETEPMFLSIDHTENNGSKHRKESGIDSPSKLHRWLKRHNFPPGFQILCMNCNVGKYRNGGICPHKTKLACLPVPIAA